MAPSSFSKSGSSKWPSCFRTNLADTEATARLTNDGWINPAIYAETIPFDETRHYVKRVMANAIFYAAIYGDGPSSLKERLGTVSSNDPAGDDDTLP